MSIVTGLTKRVEIPHEEGQWMIFRQLSWREREKASEARTDAVMARVKGMGVDLMREIRGNEDRPEVQAVLADPSMSYDKALVLQFGIVDWSYDGKPTPGAIDSLDDVTAEWAFREIIAFSSPPSEEEQKNGSSPST